MKELSWYNFFQICNNSLFVLKELRISGDRDVERVCQCTHVPGQLTGLPDERLDDGEGHFRSQVELGVTVQCTHHILQHNSVSITV